MAKERKSPQEKKKLEYTRDHFTFGWHSSRYFPQTWKRKKARVNRNYRRKSEEILAQAKPGTDSGDVEAIADDLTAARFQKSVSRKRLRKAGTVSVGEKVQRKLERRQEAAGRHARRDQRYDSTAVSAVKTLTSLAGEELVEFVRRADRMLNAKSAALKGVLPCKDNLDRALYFLYLAAAGSHLEVDALRRNPDLDQAFRRWVAKANRILETEDRARETKSQQKQAVRLKRKAARKS
jgi:hypothetical protein